MKNNKFLIENGNIIIHLLLIFLRLYIADVEERNVKGSYDCCGISHIIKQSKKDLKFIEHEYFV